MSQTIHAPSALHRVSLPLVLLLAVIGLARPLASITGLADAWGRPATPLLATVFVTIVWVVAVTVLVPDEPVLVLVLAGLAYGVLAIVLSGVLSPIVDGELDGPLTRPWTIPMVLAVNALWGLVAGILARALIDRRTFT